MTRKIYNKRINAILVVLFSFIAIVGGIIYSIQSFRVVEKETSVQTTSDPGGSEQNTNKQSINNHETIQTIYLTKTNTFADNEQIQISIKDKYINIEKITSFSKKQLEFETEDNYTIEQEIDSYTLMFQEDIESTILTCVKTDLTTGKQEKMSFKVVFSHEKNN